MRDRFWAGLAAGALAAGWGCSGAREHPTGKGNEHPAPLQEGPKRVRAALKDAAGKALGTAVFYEEPGGVRVALDVTGIEPGPHGFHIHAVGKCEGPDFASAGGHFNPAGRKHGLKNPEGPHFGDLPNLVVGPEGRGTIEHFAPALVLEGEGNALLQPGGTALVIHAKADDEVTDPAGNAGPRVACGVIAR